MKITAAVPAYNCAATIRETLDSILRQTIAPDEILVVNDGSTDDTREILNNYGSQIVVIHQENSGVAAARNLLFTKASGDLIAFLDSDDLWHPDYLKVQRGLFNAYPHAVAFFTGHVDCYGYKRHHWNSDMIDLPSDAQLIGPLEFLKAYNKAQGPFASMSYCCLPRSVLAQMGSEPFYTKARTAEDFYLINLLPLMGSVAYVPSPVVAYRIIEGSQSANRLKSLSCAVDALRLLWERYAVTADQKLLTAFKLALASKERQYAKVLIGVGRISDAREELKKALTRSLQPATFVKSLALLACTYLPVSLQPVWPSIYRSTHNCADDDDIKKLPSTT